MIDYLGHIISVQGVSADPKKIEAIMLWPKPKNIKQLRGILGITGYYKRFIKGFATIVASLTDLLKKDAFFWSEQADSAFSELKKVMSMALVLHLPDFKETFMMETDASNVGIGAVLMQKGTPNWVF